MTISSKILKFCKTKYALYVLAAVSFCESIFFLIPPEVFLVPMCCVDKKRSFYFALIVVISSVLGAIAAYLLGAFFWIQIEPFVEKYFSEFHAYIGRAGKYYEENAGLVLFIAALTPIPFKVFTLSAGIYHERISLYFLIGISLLGRGLKYFLIVGLVYFIDEPIKNLFIKHYKVFLIMTLVMGVLVYMYYSKGVLAQLDRVGGFEPLGRGFESLAPRHHMCCLYV